MCPVQLTRKEMVQAVSRQVCKRSMFQLFFVDLQIHRTRTHTYTHESFEKDSRIAMQVAELQDAKLNYKKELSARRKYFNLVQELRSDPPSYL